MGQATYQLATVTDRAPGSTKFSYTTEMIGVRNGCRPAEEHHKSQFLMATPQISRDFTMSAPASVLENGVKSWCIVEPSKRLPTFSEM